LETVRKSLSSQDPFRESSQDSPLKSIHEASSDVEELEDAWELAAHKEYDQLLRAMEESTYVQISNIAVVAGDDARRLSR